MSHDTIGTTKFRLLLLFVAPKPLVSLRLGNKTYGTFHEDHYWCDVNRQCTNRENYTCKRYDNLAQNETALRTGFYICHDKYDPCAGLDYVCAKGICQNVVDDASYDASNDASYDASNENETVFTERNVAFKCYCDYNFHGALCSQRKINITFILFIHTVVIASIFVIGDFIIALPTLANIVGLRHRPPSYSSLLRSAPPQQIGSPANPSVRLFEETLITQSSVQATGSQNLPPGFEHIDRLSNPVSERRDDVNTAGGEGGGEGGGRRTIRRTLRLSEPPPPTYSDFRRFANFTMNVNQSPGPRIASNRAVLPPTYYP